MDCSKCEVPGLPGGCHNKPLICRKCRESARAERDVVKGEVSDLYDSCQGNGGNAAYTIGLQHGLERVIRLCDGPISEREGVRG